MLLSLVVAIIVVVHLVRGHLWLLLLIGTVMMDISRTWSRGRCRSQVSGRGGRRDEVRVANVAGRNSMGGFRRFGGGDDGCLGGNVDGVGGEEVGPALELEDF